MFEMMLITCVIIMRLSFLYLSFYDEISRYIAISVTTVFQIYAVFFFFNI